MNVQMICVEKQIEALVRERTWPAASGQKTKRQAKHCYCELSFIVFPNNQNRDLSVGFHFNENKRLPRLISVSRT